MILKQIYTKIQSKLIKLCLQPIRVFCLHHVCKQFDSDAMYVCDWMALDEFKKKINFLRSQGYQFISLTEAYDHLQKDWFRRKKYAVLTFDDGYKSLKEVLPWLEEHNIPVTLFINGKYLDGKSYRQNPKEQFLTNGELCSLTNPLIEIGHHGWEHTAATEMTEGELLESLKRNIEILSSHPRYIPFWAYTYGKYTYSSNKNMLSMGVTPVLLTGGKNYKWTDSIDREML